MSAITLACARSTRGIVPRHAARTFATEALASSSSSVDVPLATPLDAEHQASTGPGSKKEKRHIGPYTRAPDKTIYVRSWDEISSMPEFFALLRGVEKRFGRVREFRLNRDSDVPTAYLSYFMVEFADDDTFNRIPARGTNIKVEVPISKTGLPGGIGLADLKDLLQSQDRDFAPDPEGLFGQPVSVIPKEAGEAEARPVKIVELIVQRAKRDHLEPYPRRLFGQNWGFGIGFHNWGGFYVPTADDPRPVPQQMVSVLKKWQRIKASKEQHSPPDTQAPLGDDVVQETATVVSSSHELGPREEEPEVAVSALPFMMDAHTTPSAEEPVASTAPSASFTPTAPTLASTLSSPEAPVPVKAPTSRPSRVTRREMILTRAREHARTRAPQILSKEEEEAKRAAEEAEKKAKEEAEKAELSTVRERLLKLLGGKWM